MLKFAKKGYILPSQFREMAHKLRNIPGTPLISINHGSLNLEDPSAQTLDYVKQQSRAAAEDDYQMQTIKALNEQMFGGEPANPEVLRKKRKGPKGPNPLSCQKKKVKPNQTVQNQNNDSDGSSKKKKRKRVRKRKWGPSNADN